MNAKKSFFVTGTDTEIGKTLVSSTLLLILNENGLLAAGMKPVAAGTVLKKNELINDDVEQLIKFSSVNFPKNLIVPYLFKEPISPNIASDNEKNEIELQKIVDSFELIKKKVDFVIVEGIGGFKVPLNYNLDTADLAEKLDLDIILVVGLRLGCLNHALLTVESIKSRGLNLLGWVSNQVDPEMIYVRENINTLKKRIDAPLIGEIPYMENPSPYLVKNFLNFN